MSVVPRIPQKAFGGDATAQDHARPLPAGIGHNGGPAMHTGHHHPGGNYMPGGYMRGERSPTFQGWHPAPRDAADEVRAAWVRAAGRANDIIQNSGWITGAIDQAVANTVGSGLRLRCLPDTVALGMTEEEGTEWAALVESRHKLWADNPLECDIEGRRTFGQMQAAAFRSWFGPGEIVSESAWKLRRGCSYGTKVRLIPAHRLSQRTTFPRLVQGVQMDNDWMPTSYWFWRQSAPTGGNREIEVEARDAAGRARIIHVFDGLPGQYRGISPLVACLETARKFDQLGSATLTSNLIRAVFAATIKSDQPTEEVLKGFLTQAEQARLHSEGGNLFDIWADMQEGWYKNTNIDLGQNGRFAHLFPGQTLEFHSAQDKPGDYKVMSELLLREILRCLGLTYESGTGDYSGATYSSVRMAVNEIFQITLYRRKNIVAPFCRPHYEAWLEEEIAAGTIPFKGGLKRFLTLRAAASRSDWVGSPMPQADPLKQMKTHEGYRNMGTITDDQICAELGTDVDDVYRQRAREMAMRKKLKLPENGPMVTPDPVADALLTEKDE